MQIKKITLISCLVSSGLIAMDCLADNLTIINNTNHDSTSVINNGACSNMLGSSGITRAHTTNVVPSSLITKACVFNKTNCKAEVHMTDNCSGPVVATVYLDIKQGIKSIQPSSDTQGYRFSGQQFTAMIEGGPAYHLKWLKSIFEF